MLTLYQPLFLLIRIQNNSQYHTSSLSYLYSISLLFVYTFPMESSPNKHRFNEYLKSPFQQSFRSKTQKAIQLINKHEEQKYNFLKTISTSKKFINILPMKNDQQYFSIIQIPPISLQQTIKVQLLPFTDQFYKIKNPFCNSNQEITSYQSLVIEEEDENSSQNTIPMHKSQTKQKKTKHKKQASQSCLNKSSLQNNNSYAFETKCKLKIFIKNYRGASSQLLIYFQDHPSVKDFSFHSHKFMITSEKIVNINMEDFLNKKWIYLRVKSRTELSMFVMRVEKQFNVTQKFLTQATEINQFISINQKQKRLPLLKGNRSLKSFKSFDKDKPNTIKKSGSLMLKPMNNPSLQNSNSEISPSSKKKNKQTLEKLKKQEIQKKKEEQYKKHELILDKKNAIQIAKEKQLKLRGKALEMKKLVEKYKVIYDEQKYYMKFLQPKLVALFILPRFNRICHQMIQQRGKGIKMAIKTRILTKKFTKIIRNKYKQSIQHIRNRRIRELVGVLNFTTLFGKILHKNNTQKCRKIIIATINLSKPGQIINHCFDHASNYRRSIRYIQKTWLNQYKARMAMFQMYVKDQAQILMTKYPYFKYIYAKFIGEHAPKNLAYKYLADESSKLKYLFEDYKQKLEEIKDFNEMNKKIVEFNKTALKKRQKPLLEVPKTPCHPSPRYFRNISFLKSMIRGWFEVQYRKWSKLNKVKNQNTIESNLKGQGSGRESLKKDASVNSIDLQSPRKK